MSESGNLTAAQERVIELAQAAQAAEAEERDEPDAGSGDGV